MNGGFFEPEKLAQVITPAGALIGLRRRDGPALSFGIAAELLVDFTDGLPVRPPVFPFRRLRHRVIEVVDVDAVGDEAWPPVVRRDLHAVGRFHAHLTFSLSLTRIA